MSEPKFEYGIGEKVLYQGSEFVILGQEAQYVVFWMGPRFAYLIAKDRVGSVVISIPERKIEGRVPRKFTGSTEKCTTPDQEYPKAKFNLGDKLGFKYESSKSLGAWDVIEISYSKVSGTIYYTLKHPEIHNRTTAEAEENLELIYHSAPKFKLGDKVFLLKVPSSYILNNWEVLGVHDIKLGRGFLYTIGNTEDPHRTDILPESKLGLCQKSSLPEIIKKKYWIWTTHFGYLTNYRDERGTDVQGRPYNKGIFPNGHIKLEWSEKEFEITK